MFAAVLDANSTQVLMAVIALLGMIFTGVMAYFTARTSRDAKTAVTKVEEVKTIAEKAVEKVDEVKVVARKIEQLSNGNMGEQLKIGMIAAQTLANIDQTDGNTQLAKTATEKYEAHLASEKASKKNNL